jgi:hypothetical protein
MLNPTDYSDSDCSDYDTDSETVKTLTFGRFKRSVSAFYYEVGQKHCAKRAKNGKLSSPPTWKPTWKPTNKQEAAWHLVALAKAIDSLSQESLDNLCLYYPDEIAKIRELCDLVISASHAANDT